MTMTIMMVFSVGVRRKDVVNRQKRRTAKNESEDSEE